MGLSETIDVLDEYGPVGPALFSHPIHFPEVRNTEGLGIEEGTTNEFVDPRFLTGNDIPAGLAGSTVFLDTANAASGGSLRVVLSAGGSGTRGTAVQFAAVASTTYTVSYTVWNPVSNPGAVLVQAQAGTGVIAAGTVNGAQTTVKGQFQNVSVTFTTTGAGTVTIYLLALWATTAGDVFWASEPQRERKAYRTSYCNGALGSGYAWTGPPDNSTSTRTPARQIHSLSGLLRGPMTLCAFVKVGEVAPVGYAASLTINNRAPALVLIAGTSVQFSSLTDAVASVNLTYAPGDVLFLGGTLDATGTIYTISASKNGGPLLTSAPVTSAAAYGGATQVELGSFNAAGQVDSGLEQVLLFNRMLPLTDATGQPSLTGLATGATVDYADDPGIVYAAATATTRGSLDGLTSAGTGKVRRLRSVPGRFRSLGGFAYDSGFGAGSTMRLSVPAGSGIGQNQLLGHGQTRRYRVKTVFTEGGLYDELFLTRVA